MFLTIFWRILVYTSLNTGLFGSVFELLKNFKSRFIYLILITDTNKVKLFSFTSLSINRTYRKIPYLRIRIIHKKNVFLADLNGALSAMTYFILTFLGALNWLFFVPGLWTQKIPVLKGFNTYFISLICTRNT